MFEILDTFDDSAWSVLLYGAAGIGKTTLATRAESAFIINLENGLRGVNLKASNSIATSQITELSDFDGALEYFITSPQKTLVIDSISKLESMYENAVCRERSTADKPVESINDIGFGIGYQLLQAKYGILFENIDAIKRAGKNVILLAHTKVVTITEPEHEPYDRTDIAVDKKVCEKIKAAVDYVWYMQREKLVKTQEGPKNKGPKKPGKATIYDKVFLQTRESGGIAAKSRGDLEMFIDVPNNETAREIWNGL